jgi:hypothetical protein
LSAAAVHGSDSIAWTWKVVMAAAPAAYIVYVAHVCDNTKQTGAHNTDAETTAFVYLIKQHTTYLLLASLVVLCLPAP